MMNRSRLYQLLGVLYTSQFVGVGFLTIGLVGILRTQGASLETLGSIKALGLVWAVKFLWAPIVDRFGGRRIGHYRLWLLAMQGGMIAALCGLLVLRPDVNQFGPLLAVSAAFVLFSSTHDIAADAIAVRLIDPDHRGMANGIQGAGGVLGNLLGGGFTVLVYDQFGWLPAVVVLIALTGSALAAVLVFRENDHVRSTAPGSLAASYASLGTVFAQPGAAFWAFAVLPVLFAGVAGANALLAPALVDVGWSLTRLGLVVTVLAALPGTIGAIAGGWLINRVGRRLPLLLGSAVVVVATLAFMPVFAGHRHDPILIATICVYYGGYAVAAAAVNTVNMDFARGESAGADYTMMNSIGMFLGFAMGALALGLAGSLGYVPVAAGSVACTVVGAALAWWHLRRRQVVALAA